MRGDVNQSSFWEGLYHAGDDRWDLGRPAPPLEALLAENPPAPSGGKVAVMGCGRGHDARLFAGRGYSVWGFDFAPRAVEEARRLAEEEGVRVSFERRDVFSLPGDFPAFFDLLWEYTCYCAIHPDRRDEYLSGLRRIIAPGGLLLALFYPIREGTDGPPFPSTDEDLREKLERHFKILSWETPPTSVERRQGEERLIRAVPLPPT